MLRVRTPAALCIPPIRGVSADGGQVRNQPLTVNQFSPLSHKEIMSSPRGGGVAPSWVVRDEDRQRLAAYVARSAYLGNVARELLPASASADEVAAHREFGDPSVLVSRIVAGVLGTDWTITVDGADADPLKDGPELPPMPKRPAPVGDEAAQALIDAVYGDQLAAWREAVAAAGDRWRDSAASQPALQARQEAVRTWSDRRHFAARVNEFERCAAGLGDAVFVLFPCGDDWPRIMVVDPGFYFSEDAVVGEFADVVHLAWEEDQHRRDGTTRRVLRRLTWELVDLTEMYLGVDSAGETTWLDADGRPALQPGTRVDERFDSTGTLRRGLPWVEHQPVNEWATKTCLYSDGTWDLSHVGPGGFTDLSDAAAMWDVRRDDLGIDFVPVVHCPNVSAAGEEWGTSAIDHVAQILDDMSLADTDASKASRFLGSPTIAMAGANAPRPGSVVAPGQMYGLGESGRMDVLDLSAGLTALMAHGDRLQDRFWQNAGVPSEVVGRADAQAIAGVTLALRFAPFAQLVGVLRMNRDPKYRLVLKFAQRMAQVAQVLEPGPTPEARLQWGNFMPTDRAETIAAVTAALNAHALSTSTAVAMLVAAGLPIEDASDEVAKIRSENGSTARDIADATGSEQLAADWLGLEVPGPPRLDFGA